MACFECVGGTRGEGDGGEGGRHRARGSPPLHPNAGTTPPGPLCRFVAAAVAHNGCPNAESASKQPPRQPTARGPALGSSAQKRPKIPAAGSGSGSSATNKPLAKGVVLRNGVEMLIPGGRVDPQGQTRFEHLWNKSHRNYKPGCAWCHKNNEQGSDANSHTIVDCPRFQDKARSDRQACIWCARPGHTSMGHTGSRGRKVDFEYYKK